MQPPISRQLLLALLPCSGAVLAANDAFDLQHSKMPAERKKEAMQAFAAAHECERTKTSILLTFLEKQGR